MATLRATELLPTTMRADSKQDNVSRGRICLICDRKYLLYDYYSEFACQVEEMDSYIKEEQVVLKEREFLFSKMKQEMHKVKLDLTNSERKIKSIREEIKNEISEKDA